MNEKLEKLNQEIEKTEKKLRWAQQEEKRLTHQAKALTRKERTHRLCTRAAMLESYLPVCAEPYGRCAMTSFQVRRTGPL